MKKNNIGFTLVELIVVITIIWILGTIAFLSIQWYISNARNSVRISDLKNIQKWLELFSVKTWFYPDNENITNITASGTIIWYQWYFWDNVARMIDINKTPVDPLNNERYVYYLNLTKNQYQLMGLMESTLWDSIKIPKTLWNNLWIILDEKNNNTKLNSIETLSWSTNFNVIFSDIDKVTSIWNWIFSNIYNRRIDLLKDKSIPYNFDENLIWYWDMENTTSSGGFVVLKDQSKYLNHWYCYNNFILVNCWVYWPKFIDWDWKSWKSIFFDWLNDFIKVNNSNSLKISSNLTIFAKIKKNYSKDFNFILSKQLDVSPFFPNNYQLYIHWNDEIRFTYYSSLWNTAYDNSKLNNKDYYTIASVYNNKNINLYLNWIITWKFITNNSLIPDNSPLFIGKDWWGNYLSWVIDEIRIYNRALSDSEIEALNILFKK